MSRLTLPLSIAAVFAVTALSKPAHADAAAQSTAPSALAKSNTALSLQGFDILATAGYGAHTSTFVDLELAPYGASFGVDLGYSWRSGFRLGGYFFHSLGHTLPQHREPLVGRPVDFTAEASSVNGGLSLGWGVPLYCFALRYKLSLGVTSMRWRFHDVSAAVAGFGDDTSPSIGFHIAPGVALLWPYGKFEGGVGFEYLAQIKDTIPSGFIGTLFVGVKL
ncbi:MAG TPA: hypothetical protein VER11_31890 [Polyangiaceae bacterium]|nr:hypothetical protein [Polyangiaceae bacterium]